MSELTKGKKGITLIALVLTIIIMLILASVVTYTGINTFKKSEVIKFVTTMQLIQAKVDEFIQTKSIDELLGLGTSVTTPKQINAIKNAYAKHEISTVDTTLFRVFSKDSLLNMFNIEDVEDEIMINFKTREIVSSNGIENSGVTYYTQYKLDGGQKIINKTQNERSLDFKISKDINGLNSTINITNINCTNATLSYKEENSNEWKTITNYTESTKTYKTDISRTGTYKFRLIDNTSEGQYSEQTVQIVLTNKPKTNNQLKDYDYSLDSTMWAYTQINGINYVWVPRFAYDNNSNLKFLKGNSDISTDNTYIDKSLWNIHPKFISQNGEELTGIWVSVTKANQTGLNLINLLDSEAETLTII